MDIKNSTFWSKDEEFAYIINLLKKLCILKSQDYASGLGTIDADFLKQEWVLKSISDMNAFNPTDKSHEWRYLCLLFSLILYLNTSFKDKDELECLSVQQTKDIKFILGTLIEIGILKNISPNLLPQTKLGRATHSSELASCKQLLGTLYAIDSSFKSPRLKSLLVTNYLKPILLSFYQILHCPLKQPSENNEAKGFTMTLEVYNNLIKDRNNLKYVFKRFVSSIHPMLYIRETMLLLDKSSPTWLKRSLSNTLSGIIRNPNGVQNILRAMLDSVGLDENDDSTKSWSILLSIAKLIFNTSKYDDFKENAYIQLRNLLKLRSNSREPFKLFERLFALCAKLLYQQDRRLCEELFIQNILGPLLSFTNNNETHVVDDSVLQSIRICYYLTSEANFDIPVIPTKVILPIIDVVFRLFLVSSSLPNLHDSNKYILLNCLGGLELNQAFLMFDALLFGFSHQDVVKVQKELEFCCENNQIIVKQQSYNVSPTILNRSEVISEIVENDVKLRTTFFKYLLNCLSKRDRYFSVASNNANLLDLENTFVLSEISERNIVVYKLLSDLTSDQNIQTEIGNNPEFVIDYIKAALQNSIDMNTHKTNDCDTDSFQMLFLLVMLLQVFVENAKTDTKILYACFIDILKVISDECTNSEFKKLCYEVVIKLEVKDKQPNNVSISALDVALRDICDPLLPIRGHALMVLAKLIEKGDKEAIERKQFLLNIFMQNLKNDDSFIYLSAIGGLASMGNMFPDTVLNTLADEYVDFARKDSEDGHEVRMKLGEVLVRITKILGEMASKHKTLLLNTFLEVTRDGDHLMRASSLSNLGEVCKVLGYKLGSIVSEILVCVHSIITTDKAPEPRRAAVTVLHQLFIGLEKEMIVFLKDDILPTYRTLKNVYYHDKDDVMRLQAQLALEQLNENMREFVFPNPQLHSEKKIIMLN